MAALTLTLATGGNAAGTQKAHQQRVLTVSKTHFQYATVVDASPGHTNFFPSNGNVAPAKQALAITSLSIDNSSDTPLIVAAEIGSPCSLEGGVVLARVTIPAYDTKHLDFSAEPLIASGGSNWCLRLLSESATGATPSSNAFAELVGYTVKA